MNGLIVLALSALAIAATVIDGRPWVSLVFGMNLGIFIGVSFAKK